MKKEAFPFAVVFSLSPPLLAQFPPIDVEWTAVRQYEGWPGAHISRDPVLGGYVWAVYNNFQGASDEVAFPFLPDGTDLGPLNPERFNVGSLDALVDLSVRDSIAYNLMYHLSLTGAPQYWHLNNAPEGTGLTMTNPSSQPEAGETSFDLLVTDEAAYVCGLSDSIYPTHAIGRIVKTDLQCNVLWTVTWDDSVYDIKGFSSVAVVGDTVVGVALPWIVLFDDVTGALIDAMEVTQVVGDAFCVSHGNRIYWTLGSQAGLRAGYYDLGAGSGQNVTISTDSTSGPRLAFDQFDRLWITETITNGTDFTSDDDEGRWYLLDEELLPVSNGSLYGGVDDMCFVNGKISFTGRLDPVSSTAYLITGTPQP